jgi:hypothetical protein
MGGGVPLPQEGPQEAGLAPPSVTKAASPPSSRAEAALDVIAQAVVKKAGYKLGKDIFLALDVASSEFYVKEKKHLRLQEVRPADPHRRRNRRLLRRAHRQVSDHLHRRRLRRRRLGHLEEAHRRHRRQGAARRRRSLRHQRRVPQEGHRDRHRQLDPREGEPDRLPHRDPRRRRAGQGEQLHRRHLASLRRDRGRHHRRHRRRHQRRPDQDRLACRTDRVAKYNQLLRIEEELGASAIYGGPGSANSTSRSASSTRTSPASARR